MSYTDALPYDFWIKYNGVTITDYFTPIEVAGRSLSDNDISSIAIPSMDGAYYQRKRKPSRYIGVKAFFMYETPEELRTKLDQLNNVFNVDKPAPIEFSDEPGYNYWGVVSNVQEGKEVRGTHIVTFTFFCPDPFKYGQQQTINFTNDAATVTNEGTAQASPVFTFTANQDLTYLQIANSAGEYNMVGRQQTVDEIIVDSEPNRFDDDMGSLDQWNNTSLITPDGGTIAGNFASDGAMVYAYGYGTGTNWHGPSLRSNLPAPIQDFRVEAKFSLRSFNHANIGRVELYLIGDDGSVIGKLAMKDILTTDTNNIAEIRIGTDKMLLQTEGYRKGAYNDFYGKLMLRRDGTSYFAQVGELVGGQMENRSNARFSDTGNTYQTKLAAVQMHIAAHGTNNPVDHARIHHVRVSEIVDTAVNEVPVIIRQGETVAFDHENHDILIEGESAIQHKDFGGQYFNLQPGDNGLFVFPDGVTTGSVKYKPRYR